MSGVLLAEANMEADFRFRGDAFWGNIE